MPSYITPYKAFSCSKFAHIAQNKPLLKRGALSTVRVLRTGRGGAEVNCNVNAPVTLTTI